MVDQPVGTVVIPITTEEKKIQYCSQHWSQFQWSLFDRNLRPVMEHYDGKPESPVFEGSTLITMAALQFFGAQVVFDQHGGCPACAFEHIIDHVADNMAIKHGIKQ